MHPSIAKAAGAYVVKKWFRVGFYEGFNPFRAGTLAIQVNYPLLFELDNFIGADSNSDSMRALERPHSPAGLDIGAGSESDEWS